MNRPFWTIEIRLVKHDETGKHPYCPEMIGPACSTEQGIRWWYDDIKARLYPDGVELEPDCDPRDGLPYDGRP